MIKLNELESILEKICPLSLSKAFIEKGHHDNSGTLITTHNDVNKILFTLDLTEKSVKRAKRLGCDTIITHHPAIYYPISNISCCNSTNSLIIAIKSNMNVISMHLNLDIATNGIDDSLAKGLGANETTVIENITENNGYGKEFSVDGISLKDFVKTIKTNFKTNRLFVYGNLNAKINKVASFCGGGSQSAVDYKGDADLIVTSDMPHHIIKELIEREKNIIVLTHYTSENYGFNVFYSSLSKLLDGKVQTYYFDDEAFK